MLFALLVFIVDEFSNIQVGVWLLLLPNLDHQLIGCKPPDSFLACKIVLRVFVTLALGTIYIIHFYHNCRRIKWQFVLSFLLIGHLNWCRLLPSKHITYSPKNAWLYSWRILLQLDRRLVLLLLCFLGFTYLIFCWLNVITRILIQVVIDVYLLNFILSRDVLFKLISVNVFVFNYVDVILDTFVVLIVFGNMSL